MRNQCRKKLTPFHRQDFEVSFFSQYFFKLNLSTPTFNSVSPLKCPNKLCLLILVKKEKGTSRRKILFVDNKYITDMSNISHRYVVGTKFSLKVVSYILGPMDLTYWGVSVLVRKYYEIFIVGVLQKLYPLLSIPRHGQNFSVIWPKYRLCWAIFSLSGIVYVGTQERL